MIFAPTIVSNKINATIFINGYNIVRVYNIKFLGFLLTDDFSWVDLINFVSRKISKIVFLINKVRFKLNFNSAKRLYFSLIYPYLTYGIIFWGNSPKSHLKLLITNYNHFIRC